MRIRAIDPCYNELTRRYKCYGFEIIVKDQKTKYLPLKVIIKYSDQMLFLKDYKC